MNDSVDQVFVLGDFPIKVDPLLQIFHQKREDADFFSQYMDHNQYFDYLHIIWDRMKSDLKLCGSSHKSVMEHGEHTSEKINEYMYAQKLLQLDTESFIMFARILMDKVGKIIASLIQLPKGTYPGDSFSDHKKFFIKPENFKYNPSYSQFLIDKTNWYEQHLLLVRDKMIAHSKTLYYAFLVSSRTGVRNIKMNKGFQISEDDRNYLLSIKMKYEKKNPAISELPNDPSITLSYLTENHINLDKEDSDRLGVIVARSGGTAYAQNIAKHLEGFLGNIAFMFRSS